MNVLFLMWSNFSFTSVDGMNKVQDMLFDFVNSVVHMLLLSFSFQICRKSIFLSQNIFNYLLSVQAVNCMTAKTSVSETVFLHLIIPQFCTRNLEFFFHLGSVTP
ncbi:hypothetical protein E2542_SST15204 [Spatholobus suberectus]|nr:hypothetical protein E2542_SST15204 [Spatholobus suberectus]